MSVEWERKRRPLPQHQAIPPATAIKNLRPFAWASSSFGSAATLAPLVVADITAPQRTRQSLQQIATILNSLIRAGVLRLTDVGEYEISYAPADLQDHPIGTPDTMSFQDALDRLASRVKDLGG